MTQCIDRVGGGIKSDGTIWHDDRPLTWADAEQRAGRRLDRRFNYAFIEGELCTTVSWTQPCTGCTNDHSDRGMGCEECGYTGRRRLASWVPFEDGEEQGR